MANNSNPAQSGKKFWRVLLWLFLSMAGAGLVLLVLFMFSGVSGEELSPDDFSRRSFRYRQIPWTSYVLTSVTYRELDNSLAQYLIDQKWLPPSKNEGQQRWDLIRDNKTSKYSHDCDARFLEPYIAGSSLGAESGWLAWSTKYPSLAPILWSSVAKLARNDVYWAIPSLMDEALRLEDESPAEFQLAISAFVADQFLNDGIDKMIDRQYQQAVDAYTISIETRPTAEAFSRRSKAYEALGEANSSESDRKSAMRLKKD